MTSKRKAGQFKAVCKIGDHAQRGVGLEFYAADAFEEHMLEAHGAKVGQCIRQRTREPGTRLAPPAWSALRFAKQVRYGFGLWKGPKLTEEGKPFEPAELAPGAHVDWMQGDATYGTEIARSGQIWCAGTAPRTVWVIPFERFPAENAVLLEQLSSGRLAFVGIDVNRSKASA